MKLNALHKSVGFEDYLNDLIDMHIPVRESLGICIFISVRESCESRHYIDGFGTYSRRKAVLGNGECMSCWDESAELAYPEEDESEVNKKILEVA